jgi:hypothetical protein
MVKRCREELTRLDAEAQEAAERHDCAVRHLAAAPEGSKERPWRVKEVAECRYNDGRRHHAFEAARRLAEILGLIAHGERDFYKGRSSR